MLFCADRQRFWKIRLVLALWVRTLSVISLRSMPAPPKGELNSLSQNLTVLPAPSGREPLAWRESSRLNRKACERSRSPGGAVAQRLRGFKWRSEKSVKAIAPTGAALAFLCFDFFFRFVKGVQPLTTGCGTQHPLRALGGTRVLLAAAPTTPPCFRRWRRSSSLHSAHQ